jgi:hypothetical protein
LRRWSVGINRLLQSIPIRIGRSTTRTARATAALTATTSEAAKHAGHRFTTGIHRFLYQRLHRAPFSVVRETKTVPVIIHHALLECCGIKISTAATASASAAITTPTPAPTIILRKKTIRTQTQSGGYGQQR